MTNYIFKTIKLKTILLAISFCLILVSSCTKQPLYTTTSAIIYTSNTDFSGGYDSIRLAIDGQYTSSIWVSTNESYTTDCTTYPGAFTSNALIVQPLPVGSHTLKMQWINGYNGAVIYTNSMSFAITANTCTYIDIPSYVQ